MRLKTQLVCFFSVVFFLFMFAVGASAVDETTYIVRLKEEVSLFSTDENKKDYEVLTETELKECLELGLVESYEENYEVFLFDEEITYPDYSFLQWEKETVKTASSENIRCLGQGVRVAVIDSGLNAHYDFGDMPIVGYNYLAKTDDITDNIGHGTFVSGIIAAKVNGKGIDGIAPYAEIVALKCFEDGVKTHISDLLDAVRDAVDVYNCDIINMSLGSSGNSTELKNVIDYVTGKGAIVVASVGNEGIANLHYPAAYDNVIGVGSVNKELVKSEFSQYNESVFVLAPGEEIVSLIDADSYTMASGTSFSAPIVSAMVATMLNIDSTLDSTKAAEYIRLSATDLGDEGYDTNYGYGLIDMAACIELMLSDTEYFAAPIIIDNGVSSVAVFNNTDSDLSGNLFFAEYAISMNAFDSRELSVRAGQVEIYESPLVNNTVKCFIWKDINSIAPVVKARVYKVK